MRIFGVLGALAKKLGRSSVLNLTGGRGTMGLELEMIYGLNCRVKARADSYTSKGSGPLCPQFDLVFPSCWTEPTDDELVVVELQHADGDWESILRNLRAYESKYKNVLVKAGSRTLDILGLKSLPRVLFQDTSDPGEHLYVLLDPAFNGSKVSKLAMQTGSVVTYRVPSVYVQLRLESAIGEPIPDHLRSVVNDYLEVDDINVLIQELGGL